MLQNAPESCYSEPDQSEGRIALCNEETVGIPHHPRFLLLKSLAA
jgi:hypothetical protein